MLYKELYTELKNGFEKINCETIYPSLGIKITRHYFTSQKTDVLPGAPSYYCDVHSLSFDPEENESNGKIQSLCKNDYSIESNHNFNFYVVQNKDSDSKGVVFLFHGLNEKKWLKYLPWAYYITKNTNKAVVLFPIAFHMDRADEQWSDSRLMQSVAGQRAARINNSDCSFVNSAISTRLEISPDRIFWSGYQTYSDFAAMIRLIRNSGISGVSPNAKIDLFGYSIGAFLSTIIMMADPCGEMADAKFFAFCGGATLDRMFPVSKYILDLKASVSIQAYFAEQTSTGFVNNERLGHYLNGLHPELEWFNIMLRYKHMKAKRESRIREISNRIYAAALEKDTVVPPEEVLNTLCGAYRNINTKVEVMDFPYEYDHITPFPLTDYNKNETDTAFRKVMEKACVFLE